MRRQFFVSLSILIFTGYTSYAQGKLSKSDLVKLDFKQLAVSKAAIRKGASEKITAYKQLLADANKLLAYEPVSVMGKKEFPPSGDKHDYMSIAPYWWPDPSKSNGLPYIRKDGEVNPEVNSYPDKEHLPVLCHNAYLLALAYYFSGDEKYAEHASKLIQVWFLDTATKMNPNLNYGQAVKGVTNGRAEGLIDTRHFIFLIDAVDLLKSSRYWSGQNQNSLKKWFTEFLGWMQTSKIGVDELNTKNNHGVWYDAQALSIALFIDSTALADKILLRATDRLDKQMDATGFFPLEMERTTSLHYSVFLLNAFIIIGQLSEKTNSDFWAVKTPSGKSLQKGFDAIEPFITQREIWKGKQINAFDFSDGFPLLLRGSTKFNCGSCMGAIKKMEAENFDSLLLNLL